MFLDDEMPAAAPAAPADDNAGMETPAGDMPAADASADMNQPAA